MNNTFRVHYLNDNNRSVHIDLTRVAAALSMADSITGLWRIPAYVTRNGSVIYDAVDPKPVIVRHV